jgi:hypothetical protein
MPPQSPRADASGVFCKGCEHNWGPAGKAGWACQRSTWAVMGMRILASALHCTTCATRPHLHGANRRVLQCRLAQRDQLGRLLVQRILQLALVPVVRLQLLLQAWAGRRRAGM